MSLADQFKIKKAGNSYILYDASLWSDPEAEPGAEPGVELFDPDYHTKSGAQQKNKKSNSTSGIGRAKVIYFQQGEDSLVLKHYYRGGAVAKLLNDRYFGFNIENSRSFKEWRLLKKMLSLGLPVPEAVAAHVRKYSFFYRADLITREIAHSRTLAEVLSGSKIDAALWRATGRCISHFHHYNVFHADLNARNILLTRDEAVYLIDFDNSYIRSDSSSWKAQNLSRLKRSLQKFNNKISDFNFDEDDWSALLDGYEG